MSASLERGTDSPSPAAPASIRAPVPGALRRGRPTPVGGDAAEIVLHDEDVPHHPRQTVTTMPEHTPLDAPPRLWPLYVAGFAATYTFSIGNVAAPDIAADLGATPGEISLVLGSFTSAFATVIVLGGRLGDRFGRRRMFVLGLVGGSLTAILAAVAPTTPLLIAARGIQGIAAALVMPQILATIQATSTGIRRARGIATFSATSGVGTAAGQVIGGSLISADIAGTGWRGAAASIAVICALALAGARWLPATRSDRRDAIDIGGAVIVGLALASLVFGLSLGPGQHWSWWTLALLVGGVVGLAAFWRHQSVRERTGRPTLAPPSVVRLTPVWAGLLMALMFFGGFGAFMYEYSVLTQRHLGLTPAASGFSLLLFVLGFVLASASIGHIMKWWGALTMERGACLQLLGLVLVAGTCFFASHTGSGAAWVWWVQAPVAFLGFAQGTQFAPLVSTVMSEVPHSVAGLTGGFVSTAQQAALALGVATLGGLFVSLADVIDPVAAFGWVVAAQGVTAVVFWGLARRLRHEAQQD